MARRVWTASAARVPAALLNGGPAFFAASIAEGAARKVPPQVEVLQLDARPLDEVAGQQRQRHIVTPLQFVEQRRDARHHVLDAGAGVLDLVLEMADVALAQIREQRRVDRAPVLRHDVGEDAPVGAPGELHVRHCVVSLDDVLAGAVHGAPSGSSGQDERSVNIEKNEVHYATEAE